uniref:Cytochrome c oxidase subunit 2 n=1 Tax=Zygeupolia rubens TaxID=166045 RepID=I1SR65_9BILA|nr:cytochrome c oxidase subunit II [Zygeupolia rubens]ADZ05385.1 cytochrome c oxidase subunit II [Zygeupolia rubens]
MAMWSQWGLQDAASPLMEQLIFFHDHAMLVLVLIVSLVGYAAFTLMRGSFTNRYLLECQEIEAVWTVLPAVFLIFLALPSLRLLYLLDEVNDPGLSVKAVGHQWYWSYEYSDFLDLDFDSYMVPVSDLSSGDYRLLEVDHRTVVPVNVDVRVLVTAADVLHSWAVPSLGVKADAVPGRLNQVSFYISRPGVYYGQCSEICGANHSFMPIVVEAIEVDDFVHWVVLNGS